MLAHGPRDQVVAWVKPDDRPGWMTEEEFAALPGEMPVRELTYAVARPGFSEAATSARDRSHSTSWS